MEYQEEDVIGFDALYESAMRCRKGVLWKDSTAAYYHRAIDRTALLSEQLRTGTYKPSPPKHFTVKYPKPRDIASIAFRDRVYQRSLNDNVVYPIMTRSFIYDNFACQKGKGTDAARNRLKQFLQEFYRKHGTSGWVAQIDVKGYYPNMRHDVVEAMFREKLPGWAAARVVKILREQYAGEKGYSSGSQLVQIAGISLLNGLDHKIKERLRVRWYIRYMDDLILIHPDRATLERCLEVIGAELGRIGMELNQKKTRIYPLSEGIPFLGFRFRLTGTGKVLQNVKPEMIKAWRRKLYRLVKKSKAGGLDQEGVDMAYQTFRNHISKGNSYNLVRRMDQYYTSLWNGGKKDESNAQQRENPGADRPGERHGPD